MLKETLKRLKETKEERMLKNKKRDNFNSFGCDNNCTFNTSRSKYKFNIR